VFRKCHREAASCFPGASQKRTGSDEIGSEISRRAAQAIIASVPQVVGRDHVFGVRGNGFTGWQRAKQALDDHLVNVVDAWNLHDLRRSLATRMVELDVEPHIVEAILNHYSGHRSGVAGVYNCAKYARQIRSALTLWDDHLRSLLGGGERKILPFASPAA